MLPQEEACAPPGGLLLRETPGLRCDKVNSMALDTPKEVLSDGLGFWA